MDTSPAPRHAPLPCQQRYRCRLEKNATQMAAISWRLTHAFVHPTLRAEIVGTGEPVHLDVVLACRQRYRLVRCTLEGSQTQPSGSQFWSPPLDTTPALAVGRLLATRFATHKFWQPSTTAGPTGAGSASGSGSAGTHSRDPLHSPSSPHINSPEPCRWNPSSHITLHSLPNAVWQECRLKATTWSSAEKISLSARSLLRCCQE